MILIASALVLAIIMHSIVYVSIDGASLSAEMPPRSKPRGVERQVDDGQKASRRHIATTMHAEREMKRGPRLAKSSGGDADGYGPGCHFWDNAGVDA